MSGCVPPLLCGCFGLAGHSSLPSAPFVVSLGVIRTKGGSGGCRGSTAGWEGAHGQDDPVGRMTTGAVGPAVPDRWNHCTPSSRSHCWLQPYLPLQFPAWQCLSWLREQEHPRQETMPAAPSTRTVTGWSRVPLPPWGAPSSRGPGCEKVPQANKKNP